MKLRLERTAKATGRNVSETVAAIGERLAFLFLQLSDFAEPAVENCFCSPDAVGVFSVWVVHDCRQRS